METPKKSVLDLLLEIGIASRLMQPVEPIIEQTLQIVPKEIPAAAVPRLKLGMRIQSVLVSLRNTDLTYDQLFGLVSTFDECHLQLHGLIEVAQYADLDTRTIHNLASLFRMNNEVINELAKTTNNDFITLVLRIRNVYNPNSDCYSTLPGSKKETKCLVSSYFDHTAESKAEQALEKRSPTPNLSSRDKGASSCLFITQCLNRIFTCCTSRRIESKNNSNQNRYCQRNQQSFIIKLKLPSSLKPHNYFGK